MIFLFANVSGIGELLPIKQKTFGLVYCRQVLHHANDLQTMMEEISRVLIPGGIFWQLVNMLLMIKKLLKNF